MTTAVTRLQLYPDAQYTTYDVESRADDTADLFLFLQISAELCGFTVAELQSTGNAAHLFEELGAVVGITVRDDFLRAVLAPEARLADPFHGPLSRNVIRMWYLGRWKRLSDEWVSGLPDKAGRFDEFGRNFDRVLSARAYREGLAWRAIGANPPAAKQPGFASWAEPPR